MDIENTNQAETNIVTKEELKLNDNLMQFETSKELTAAVYEIEL